jgi:predicted RNase H-like HicB family nuclease
MPERHVRGPRHGEAVTLKINVVIEPDGDGFYAFAPGLPGVHVGGDTFAETIETVRDAVELHLSCMLKHGEPIPIGPDLTAEYQPTVPKGARTEMLTIPWPRIPQTCGASSRL